MAPHVLKLYEICLERVSRFLERKFRVEAPNPFSALPPCVLHDLVAFTLRLHSQGGFRAHHLEPLLLTGQVKHLALCDVRLDEELVPTLRSFTVCRGLRSLRLLDLHPIDPLPGSSLRRFTVCSLGSRRRPYDAALVSGPLGQLLCALTGLEELYCCLPFSLSALRGCRSLREVRLHFTPREPLDALLPLEGGRTHHALERFTLCGKCTKNTTHPDLEVAELLANCPRLRSLGYLDISSALGILRNSEMDPEFSVREFSLRSCCWWGDRRRTEERFLSSFQAAAPACPHLNELVIRIPQRFCQGVLCVLPTLRNLTYLEIHMDYPGEDFRPDFASLLLHVGSGLRHLALHRIDNIELDAILGSCPELLSLRVDCDRAVGDWSDASPNPQRLRRLSFFSYDGCCGENSLRLMLSKCSNLQELFLKNAEFLSDSFLSRVMRDSPTALSQLETACLCDCCLTRDGLRKLLGSARGLRRICVESSRMSAEEVESAIREFNSSVTIIPEYNEAIRDEYFFRRQYACV